MILYHCAQGLFKRATPKVAQQIKPSLLLNVTKSGQEFIYVIGRDGVLIVLSQ